MRWKAIASEEGSVLIELSLGQPDVRSIACRPQGQPSCQGCHAHASIVGKAAR